MNGNSVCILAAEAEDIGHGGVLQVSEFSWISRKTIIKGKKGLRELNASSQQLASENMAEDRIRKAGGGRKELKEQNPEL